MLRRRKKLRIYPTLRCNLKCNYCIHASSNMKNKKTMEWSIFLKLCEQMKDLETLRIEVDEIIMKIERDIITLRKDIKAETK